MIANLIGTNMFAYLVIINGVLEMLKRTLQGKIAT